MNHTCDHIKCERNATYYATQQGRHEADGFFCYWHIPVRWNAEPLLTKERS